MAALEEPYLSEGPPRCARCGDVMGVYEPLIHVADERVRRTSRAAEPDVCRADGVCYHASCYEGDAFIS